MTAVAVISGYFIGSIPFAFLLARRRGIDLRRAGSGNVGASNVLRTTGTALAVMAMALDALKGTSAVLLAQGVAPGASTAVAAGLASMIGHVYPVWLRFHGGKGVATAAGAFGVLAPAGLGIAAAVFVMMVVLTRIVSVASIGASITLAIATVATGSPAAVTAGAAIGTALIVFRHRENLSRLAAGTERRVGGA